jgi:hypothetical protein
VTVSSARGHRRLVGGPLDIDAPTPRQLAADLRSSGQTLLVADPSAEGWSAPLSCFGALASAVAAADPTSAFVARFSEQLPFDERLALLEASLAELASDIELLLERPAAWGVGGTTRQARTRCRKIFEVVAASSVDLVFHQGSAKSDAETRAGLEALAEELVPARMAELRHPERPLEALAATVLSAVDTNPRATIARRVLAAGAWAGDWHPAVWTDQLDDANDPLAHAARTLFESDGDSHRLSPAVRSAARAVSAERWITDGVRRRLLVHARERADGLQEQEGSGACRALVEAARMAAELGDVAALAEIGVLGSELLDAAAATLHAHGRARALDVMAQATRIDSKDGDALRHYARTLDAGGVELDAAAALYRQAIKADGGDVDAHEGLVSLWLARADEVQARTDLHLARLDLEQAGVAPVADDLLIPVAATALRRARTGFARDALAMVPQEQRSSLWRDHWQYLLGLEAAEAGRDYVPLHRLGPGWWRDGPQLLARHEPTGPLREWVAGLVTELDEDHDELVIEGARVHGDADPEPTSVVLDRATYDRAQRDGLPFADLADRYVELGIYETSPGQPELIMRAHRRQQPPPPATKLDPRRVLRPQRLT